MNGTPCPWCKRKTRFHKGIFADHVNETTKQRCQGAWQPKQRIEALLSAMNRPDRAV